MKSKSCRKSFTLASGYSLIELMLALAIGVVALSATLGMYTNYKNGMRTTESTLTMQTNARFAFEFIANSLRNVGSMGCRSNKVVAKGDTLAEKMQDDSFIALADTHLPWADFHYGHDVEGYEASGTGWIPAPVLNYAATMNPGSDAIKIVGAVGAVYNTTGAAINASDTQVQLNMAGVNRVDLVSGGYASISTCASAQIFKVTSSDGEIQAGIIKHGAGAGDGNELNTFEEGTNVYAFSAGATFKSSGDAEVRRMATTSYYIADNDAGIPTLFRDVDNVSTTPLVTGVERMQIEYGVNTNPADRNVANVYLNAQQIDAGVDPISWGNVVSVRISLTMRSYDPVYNVALSGKTYSMPLTDGTTDDYVSNDRFARYKYTSTVVLRNRVVGNRI